MQTASRGQTSLSAAAALYPAPPTTPITFLLSSAAFSPSQLSPCLFANHAASLSGHVSHRYRNSNSPN
jgi:hypothetical protein